MDDMYVKRNIMCIDLKSFFASCECVERGLDPFKVPLVVANKKQGNGAITLAVTPALKNKVFQEELDFMIYLKISNMK